jgi:hypothetical protein
MRKAKNISVVKASGEILPFSEEKLRKSLMRSGASDELIDAVIGEVLSSLYEGISTKKIYQIAFSLLKKKSRLTAGKYHLKRAIMELGPSGFPFEKYFGEILKHEGYSVVVGQIVKGKCVNHEIDVIAERDNHHFMIECKYHNHPGTVSDVKIPLYIQARFKDVEAAWIQLPGHSAKFHQGWVVTNTRFTGDAITYGNCAGLKLIGWSYPDGDSLRNRIDRSGLYPVTCLTTINKKEKQELLTKKVVLCQEVLDNDALLLSIGIKPVRINGIIHEARQLCNTQIILANK